MTSRSETSKSRRSLKVRAGNLCLTLHREFFDAIVAGTKKTEYRENKDYWQRRLVGRIYREVHFRNGYATKAPFMRVQCKGIRKVRRKGKTQFTIRLGKILELNITGIANYVCQEHRQIHSRHHAFPPLAEQQRIVAQVDELMTLCDKLEAQLAITHTESRRFLESVLHEALAPAV